LEYLYTNDRFSEMATLLERTEAPLNSDIRPVCYQFTLLLWLSKFFPVLAWLRLPQLSAEELMLSPLTWFLLAGVVLLLLLARRRQDLKSLLLVAAAGFMGMVLETALILYYQVTSGVLYQDLGLLLTLFMAGLALGAAAVARMARRRQPDPAGGTSADLTKTTEDRAPLATGRFLTTRPAALFLLGFVGLALAAAGLMKVGGGRGWVVTGSFLLGSGVLVAGLFAFVSLYHRADQRSLVSPLYAADLFGGCLGSVIASLFLIPVFGLAGTCLLVVVLALVSFLVL
jgi:spermidine synthase